MTASQFTNEEIAELFEQLGMMLEMQGDTVFKIRAYQRAARTIEGLSFSLAQAVADGQKLTAIPGVGKAISEKIQELVTTGQVQTYERVKAELPEGALDLLAIPVIGPKTAVLIGTELGISTVEGVEQAAQDGRLATLPRMGKKASESILRHIRASRTMTTGRTPIGQAMPTAETIMAALRERDDGVTLLTPAGSLRRWEETIGDVDLVAITPKPEELGRCLAALPQVTEVLLNGPRKTSVIVEPGLQIDLRTGEEVNDVDPTAFDQRAQALNPETGREAPENNAGLTRLPLRALVYELRDGDGLDLVVLPVEGLGLWSTLYGFLALDADLETIRGLTFYQHLETPGLGGEVDNPRWKSLWPGRKAFDGTEPRIEVIRGRAGPPDEDPFRVDGISGATMTGRGVTNLLRFWLGNDGFRPYLGRLGVEGAA